VSEVSFIQVTIILLSGVISWIIDDCIANALLLKKEKGTKIRFIGARWLTRKKAIIVAFIQFAIALIASFFLQDFFNSLYAQAISYMLPICMFTISLLYPYILLGLPYKIKVKHIVPSILLILLSILLFVGIYSISIIAR
jgi:hypothetical protein